jgi:hypothetical protein
MASQPTTNLETHPVNTAGLNGIINGNWERLEAIFLPLMAAVNGSTIAWNHLRGQPCVKFSWSRHSDDHLDGQCNLHHLEPDRRS